MCKLTVYKRFPFPLSGNLVIDNCKVIWRFCVFLKTHIVDRNTCYNIIKLIDVIWSSSEVQTVDALAARGDEGRSNLR